MDWVRLGLVIRALRRRRGWRQIDLARVARVSQTLISRIERGHGDRVTGEVLRRVAAAVEARFLVEIRWRAGYAERLIDGGHARLAAVMAQLLRDAGWDVRLEVTYESTRTAGSIDILAWHAATATLLVIEIKTDVTSAEATLRKLDEKVRLAAGIVLARFGWRAGRVARLLVMEMTSTNRRRIDVHRSIFDGALPARDDEVRRWLRRPSGGMDGRVFVSSSPSKTGIDGTGGRHRVRRKTQALPEAPPNGRSTTSIDREHGFDDGPIVLRG